MISPENILVLFNQKTENFWDLWKIVPVMSSQSLNAMSNFYLIYKLVFTEQLHKQSTSYFKKNKDGIHWFQFTRKMATKSN